MEPKRIPLDEFKAIYNRVPRLCVEVVISKDGGVVLSKRDVSPAKGMWHIPGGTVLFGETLEGAVKRVAKEELGVKVKVGKIIDVIEYRPNKYAFGHAVGIAFLTHITSGTLTGSNQAQNVEVFTTIPENTIPEQGRFLNRHFGMKPRS